MGALIDDGLATLRAALQRHLDAGYAPGVVAAVSRGEESHLLPLGTMAFGSATPMPPDALFRIASMTKPITAAAVMMLVEDGKLRLDEPVDRLLPELADRRVLRRIDADLDDTVPARRAITVEDLLIFRLGLGLVLAPPGAYPIQRAIETLGLAGFGRPDPGQPFGPDEWLRRLSTLPLMAQPGERWMYTTGSNVLGVLVARAAGQPLEQVLEERIFEPLGMNDTAFGVADGKIARFVPAYRAVDGAIVAYDDPVDGVWRRRPAFPAGDAGLISTAGDFLTFARMLQAGGVHQGRRLLSPVSVEAMTTDQLTPAQRTEPEAEMVLTPGHGWGYGLSVASAPTPDEKPLGAFGWCGGLGTSWTSDPATGLTAILLTQREFDSPDPPAIHKEFHAAARQALAA